MLKHNINYIYRCVSIWNWIKNVLGVNSCCQMMWLQKKLLYAPFITPVGIHYQSLNICKWVIGQEYIYETALCGRIFHVHVAGEHESSASRISKCELYITTHYRCQTQRKTCMIATMARVFREMSSADWHPSQWVWPLFTSLSPTQT